MSFGTVVVLVGLVILVGWIPIGQRFGLGTIVNTLTVGFIVDAILRGLPAPKTLACGGRCCSPGSSSPRWAPASTSAPGSDPGPRRADDRHGREGLAALGACARCSSSSALVAGWALGGDVGIGTVLFAFSIGPLAHWFLARLHLGVGGVDPDPTATVGE